MQNLEITPFASSEVDGNTQETDKIFNSTEVITEDNRSEQHEAVQVELAELLAVDEVDQSQLDESLFADECDNENSNEVVIEELPKSNDLPKSNTEGGYVEIDGVKLYCVDVDSEELTPVPNSENNPLAINELSDEDLAEIARKFESEIDQVVEDTSEDQESEIEFNKFDFVDEGEFEEDSIVDDVVIDEQTDAEVEMTMAQAEFPTGSLQQRVVGSAKVIPNLERPNIPKFERKDGRKTYADKARDLWRVICNAKANFRFCAAVEVCSSKVGTLQETIQYLMKGFPVLAKYKFDEKMFNILCEEIPEVSEAWGFGVFGDEVGDRLVIDLARNVCVEKYKNRELEVAELHKYAQIRDTFENIKIRQMIAEAKCKEMLGISDGNEQVTSVVFSIEKRDQDGEDTQCQSQQSCM